MGPLTEAADQLHAMKYRGDRETFRDAINRVSKALADGDEHYHKLREILGAQRFLPGGRIQAAMGSTRSVTAVNCFVSGTIADSFTDDEGNIMQRAHEAAKTMRMGGGIGYDFSTLRPRGALIKKLMSHSSGPVSFMRIFNEVCLATSSAGHRRGAQMGVMRVDHPDIEEFVNAKHDNTTLTGFNISVAITDEFMEAVAAGSSFKLRFGGEVYNEVDAQELWEQIMRSTFDWAEPGVIFIDTMNRLNNLKYCETIAATNPCFAAGTLIATDEGAFPIESLVGRTVNIWDGAAWRKVDNFRETGRDQEMIRFEMQDGSSFRVTHAHKMILADGSRVRADEVKITDQLQLAEIEYDGEARVVGAYIKGFLVGDGTSDGKGKPILYLYPPKADCRDRLVESASEVMMTSPRTNAISELLWLDQVTGRQTRQALTGLAVRKEDLNPWASTFKDELPIEVYSWNRRSKCEFLAGLFDADGCTVDSPTNGFSYQFSGVSRPLLEGVQILLKSIGVRSKIGLMHLARTKEMPGGTYDCQACWRLTIAQAGAVHFAKQVTFSRLKSFADRELKYNVKPRAGRIQSISADEVDPIVYCCTVEGSHAVTLAQGVTTGNCGEQNLPPFGACVLGSVNLSKYLSRQPIAVSALRDGQHSSWSFSWDLLKSDMPAIVRAMDNVCDRSKYPLPQQHQESLNKRRIGIGVTALANAGEAMGMPYGSKEFLEFEHKVMGLIAREAYLASVDLAKEKGAFPLFDAEQYGRDAFLETLDKDVVAAVRKHGIRNSHLLSVAPTGTISLTADNVSGGLEPVFAYSTQRPIHTPFGQKIVEIEDYGVAQLGVRGRVASDISTTEHVDVLVAAQAHLDAAASKTCNVPPGTPWAEFKDIYRRSWEGGAKGCATFSIEGKRFALLTAKPEDEGITCRIDPESGRRDCA